MAEIMESEGKGDSFESFESKEEKYLESDEEEDDGAFSEQFGAGFGDVLASLSAVKIRGTRNRHEEKSRKQYTVYIIRAEHETGGVWDVERRYNEFYALHKALKLKYDREKIPRFPRKQWQKMRSSVIERRQKMLEEYLVFLTQFCPSELITFLEFPQHLLDGSTDPDQVANARRGEVTVDDFELLRVIGRGSYGKVFLVRHRETKTVYAMKVLKKAELSRRNQVEHTLTERRIMAGVDHPFINALRFAFQSPDKLYFVTDYFQGGELFFHLKKAGRFSEDLVRFYATEIASALCYLHEKDIVYRDLKPENILLDKDGHLCITDFGLSKEEVDSSSGALTFCGTPEYLAPEVLRSRRTGRSYGKAIDWWSLGTLIYEMLYGLPPFFDKNLPRMCEKILRNDLTFPAGVPVSDEAKDLISRFLIRDPNERLGSGESGSQDVKSHPFFTYDWDQIHNKQVPPPYRPTAGIESDIDVRNFDKEFTEEAVQVTPTVGSILDDVNDDFANFTFVPQSKLEEEN